MDPVDSQTCLTKASPRGSLFFAGLTALFPFSEGKIMIRTVLTSIFLIALSACATDTAGYGPTSGMTTDYQLTFRNFEQDQIFFLLDRMDAEGSVGDHEGGRSAWQQNYRSDLNSAELTALLHSAIAEMGITPNAYRISNRELKFLEVELLSYGRGR